MSTKKPPEEVKLSREEGEALIERLETDRLTADDRRLLVKLIQLYFWLTLALRETKLSLKRLKVALFGKGSTDAGQKTDPPPGGGGGSAGLGAGSSPGQSGSGSVPEKPVTSERPGETDTAKQRRGHGRQGAEAYWGAKMVVCRHEELGAGERCPACGLGTLYRLPSGVEIPASMGTPCYRRCATSWRSGAVRPAVRCSPLPYRRQPAQRNIPRRHGRCWR